jgi:tetratricopeptide (TPR) repeat protein
MRRLSHNVGLILGALCIAGTTPATAHATALPDSVSDEMSLGTKAAINDADSIPPNGYVTTPSEPSRELSHALTLFAHDDWQAAAIELQKVADGATHDDHGNRQIAEYRLGISLFNLQLYQSSLDVFSRIATNKCHVKRLESITWFGRLAGKLPESAHIESQLAPFNEQDIRTATSPDDSQLRSTLLYLLGRQLYQKGDYNAALSAYHGVESTSDCYKHAQFQIVACHVRLRKSVPAIKQLQCILTQLEAGTIRAVDSENLRDLINLSLARIYYSGSIKINPETNIPTVSGERLTMAVRYWEKVSKSSAYYVDVLFEEAWAYFMAGHYAEALGNVYSIRSPYFPPFVYPEADVLKAAIYFSGCDYEKTVIQVARVMSQRGFLSDLTAFRNAQTRKGVSGFYDFIANYAAVHTVMKPEARTLVTSALTDRSVGDAIAYAKAIESEQKRLIASPALNESSFGEQLSFALRQQTITAKKAAVDLALARLDHSIAEYHEAVRNGEGILIDITAAQRHLLSTSRTLSYSFGRTRVEVKPDDDHIIWPFDGEYWRDEIGTYRQIIFPVCEYQFRGYGRHLL